MQAHSLPLLSTRQPNLSLAAGGQAVAGEGAREPEHPAPLTRSRRRRNGRCTRAKEGKGTEETRKGGGGLANTQLRKIGETASDLPRRSLYPLLLPNAVPLPLSSFQLAEYPRTCRPLPHSREFCHEIHSIFRRATFQSRRWRPRSPPCLLLLLPPLLLPAAAAAESRSRLTSPFRSSSSRAPAAG